MWKFELTEIFRFEATAPLSTSGILFWTKNWLNSSGRKLMSLRLTLPIFCKLMIVCGWATLEE